MSARGVPTVWLADNRHADGWQMRRARWKRKRRLITTLHVRAKLLYGGRRIGACSDFAWPSGTLGSSAIPPTAVPWRRVPTASGCKIAFDQRLFPRVPLRYALPGRSERACITDGPMAFRVSVGAEALIGPSLRTLRARWSPRRHSSYCGGMARSVPSSSPICRPRKN